MYENKTPLKIQTDMLTTIGSQYDKTEGSFFYDATYPPASEISKAYVELDKTVLKFSIDNLVGTELAARISEKSGLTRKVAQKATTTVTITGNVGASVAIGDKVASNSANYLFTEAKTIDSTGTVTVNVICELFGIVGNVPIGAIKYFPVTLAGLTTVTNPTIVTSGFEEETDKELLIRHYDRLRAPTTSGNKAMFRNWAKEVVGVSDARVLPLWNGTNTVKVVIIDSNKQPASGTLVTACQTYIDPSSSGLGDGVSPIGSFCTVVSATALTINVSFTLIKDAGYTLATVTNNINASLIDFLKSIAFIDTQVSYAKVGQAILQTKGVIDYTSLTVNSGTSNIAIANTQIAILGVVTIA